MHRLIIIGPLPPPRHGVTIATSRVLENGLLRQRFAVEHVDTSDSRSDTNINRWGFHNIRLGMVSAVRLAFRLRGEPGIVYLPLSQGTGGFLRDSLFVFVSRLGGWHVAAHLHGGEFDRFATCANRLLRRWIHLTMRQIHSVAVLDECLRPILEGFVVDERVAVVGNGVPEPCSVDVERDENHVLFLSNLRRRKGVVEAVQAAMIVVQRRPQTTFTFAGVWESPELRAELLVLAQPAAHAIQFRAVGDPREKDCLLARASVFLFSPREPEGQPLVILEAMAAELPSVTTDRGAIRSTVVDGEGGFVLGEPIPGELADALIRVLDDRRLRVRMGRAARVRYLSEFTQEHFDRRVFGWLSSLVPDLGGCDH